MATPANNRPPPNMGKTPMITPKFDTSSIARTVSRVARSNERAALTLQSRKVDLAQYTICHDSMKKQSEALSLKIVASTLARQQKLQEMTNLRQEGRGSFMGWMGGIGLVA
eukprot:GFUD01003995.1.p2 GENE.GFUD01003995.1~~GFUD01003995.1.p2  ORF type:complete len:111 (+),score=21.98 GFUD01003995.1:842-1174(+)